ncbi:5-oxoprolinase subunit PxpB [Lysobacter changpingensis]|uniref:5-oxoprolinase subunit PxpB n=1 Tax=Lysobacter changpingensis TaxID=2792784 RepID=UPI002A4E2725|nr:5-oxoprolinase subunit PxpB [Lysobacter changpingensis]
MSPRAACDIEALADDAWLLRFGDRIDPELNAAVHAMAARLRARQPGWLRDLVPAYASLGVFFDPAEDAARVHGELLALVDEASPTVSGQRASGGDCSPLPLLAGEGVPRLVEIPVLYGGEHGSDLESSASELGLSPAELIARHTAGDYTVAMIGFAPGFPYLSGLDPALALPRLATPRARVAAGSVAIGGAQTGIYPRESPGGWRVLGRTPWVLFDPDRQAPTRLLPGDRVRFRAIDADEFARLGRGQDTAS